MVWLRFAAIQLISLVATIVGWFLLIPFVLSKAWTVPVVESYKGDGRMVDRWKLSILNPIYGNPEDGVSGQQAIIYTNGVPGPYMPGAWAPWRAYLWSGWRNSSDNLKYVFACSTCPLKTGTLFGKFTYKIGWQEENGYKVPVLSIR